MPRIHNGKTWTEVLPENEASVDQKKRKHALFRRRSRLSSDNKDTSPVAPVLDGDGKILVTIPSFRDGHHCGATLLELFEKAENPDDIVVSLIEQQREEESYCLEVYCKTAANVDILNRFEYRKDHLAIVSNDLAKERCPRINQIRVVRVHDSTAKGPPWARAMGRRSLGNEEFCLQASTHSSFVPQWDTKVRAEWLLAKNEYAILSNPPKAIGVQGTAVPRLCGVEFLEQEKLPHYKFPEGKVDSLEKPLLAHTWSPGFSFGKCHMEEAAPADGFLPYLSSDIEAFARYARMWTRGYDVYTPTQNIVFHKVFGNPAKLEWINNWYGEKFLFLQNSLKRIRSYLEIPLAEDETSTEKLDNLGIYGIGKRRSLKELNDFVGIDLETLTSRSPDAPCGNFKWVPYDSAISPMENLYSNPDDLDPQPEFPLRTNLTFSDNSYGESMMNLDEDSSSSSLRASVSADPLDPSRVPYGTIFLFWILGLGVWCNMFVFSSNQAPRPRRKKNKSK